MVKREAGKAMARKGPRSSSGREGLPALNTVALGGLSALLVATPLVPSESTAELGVGVNWIMALLILCAGWLVAVVVRRANDLRWDAMDVLVGLFVALVSFSALVMAGQGCARATINMAWQWGGLGILFLLARQWLRQPAAVRAISSVMIGLAVCLTVVAYYQYFYSLPKTRAEFARNPEAMLREAGIDPAPDSPEHKLFEDRLNSTEPLATFCAGQFLGGLSGTLVPCRFGGRDGGVGRRGSNHGAKTGPSRQDMQTPPRPGTSGAGRPGGWSRCRLHRSLLVADQKSHGLVGGWLGPWSSGGLALVPSPSVHVANLGGGRGGFRSVGRCPRGRSLGSPGAHGDAQVAFVSLSVLGSDGGDDCRPPLVRFRTGKLSTLLHGLQAAGSQRIDCRPA